MPVSLNLAAAERAGERGGRKSARDTKLNRARARWGEAELAGKERAECACARSRKLKKNCEEIKSRNLPTAVILKRHGICLFVCFKYIEIVHDILMSNPENYYYGIF